jgi:hypothetical protein
VAAIACTPAWADLARSQGGVVTWQQVVALTGDRSNARRYVRGGRWQIVLPGIYTTFTGPVSRQTWWWAVLLHAGRGAAFGGEAALWLAGLRDRPPAVIEICVPHGRQVCCPPGVVVRSRCDLDALVQPARRPARLRVEEAVLDVAHTARRPSAVVDVVLAAVQRRLTTPTRLRTALDRRHRHRWRALVQELTDDADGGVHSALEQRYLRRVERPHGLPRAGATCGWITSAGSPAPICGIVATG